MDVPDAAPRSHLGDGRSVWLDVPAVDACRWVVDAEIAGAVPPALAARLGTDGFWERWTRAECVAKLTAVPVVVLLGRHGLDVPLPDGVSLRTEHLRGLVVSSARAGSPGDEAAARCRCSEPTSGPGPVTSDGEHQRTS